MYIDYEENIHDWDNIGYPGEYVHGDNVYIENCILESRGTIAANTSFVGEGGKPRIVIEDGERYVIQIIKRCEKPNKRKSRSG